MKRIKKTAQEKQEEFRNLLHKRAEEEMEKAKLQLTSKQLKICDKFVAELVEGRRHPFETEHGDSFQGDVFHSDIDYGLKIRAGKDYPTSMHSYVCNKLRILGYLVHS